MRLDPGNRGSFGVSLPSTVAFDHPVLAAKAISLSERVRSESLVSKTSRNLANVGQ
jgi:hypothetical protein